MAKYTLFHTSKSESLATKVSERLGMPIGKLYYEKFQDGEVFVRFDESVRNRTVFLLAQVNMPYENLFELFMAIDAARRASAREVVCILPYMPHSRQERRDKDRAAIAARIIADFLHSAGCDRLITIDLHTSSIEGLFKMPVDHLDTTRTFVQHIQQQGYDNLCLCSPDFGGVKRIKRYKQQLGCDLAVINKERLKANQIAHMEIIGDVTGKHVILVDDIIDTAGTLCKAAELLMESGATGIHAYCTHALMSGNAMERIEQSPILKVVASDSIPSIPSHPKIEMVSCADMIVRAVKRLI